jgi:hypothetical protein
VGPKAGGAGGLKRPLACLATPHLRQALFRVFRSKAAAALVGFTVEVACMQLDM